MGSRKEDRQFCYRCHTYQDKLTKFSEEELKKDRCYCKKCVLLTAPIICCVCGISFKRKHPNERKCKECK